MQKLINRLRHFLNEHPIIAVAFVVFTLVGAGIGYSGILVDAGPIKGLLGGAFFGIQCGIILMISRALSPGSK